MEVLTEYEKDRDVILAIYIDNNWYTRHFSTLFSIIENSNMIITIMLRRLDYYGSLNQKFTNYSEEENKKEALSQIGFIRFKQEESLIINSINYNSPGVIELIVSSPVIGVLIYFIGNFYSE